MKFKKSLLLGILGIIAIYAIILIAFDVNIISEKIKSSSLRCVLGNSKLGTMLFVR